MISFSNRAGGWNGVSVVAMKLPLASLAGYVWGYNNAGGLGIGSVARAMVPVPAEFPGDTVDLQGGTDFTVALTSTGEVWTWGGNGYGQLGDGANRLRLAPYLVQLPGEARGASMSVGAYHVLVLSEQGSLFGWGRNTNGQLGDGTSTNRSEPVPVPLDRVGRLATGVASSQAVTVDGTLLSWGRPITAVTGSLLSTGFGATPASVSLSAGAKAAMVVAGDRHMVVLTSGGELLTFGVDPGGKPLPASIPTDPAWGRVTSISAGDHHTVALTNSGVVLAWGANYYGQLGTRDTANRATPVPVRIPKLQGRIVEIVAGGDSVLARSSRHQVYAWGQGRFGQNANNATTDQTRPSPVSIPHHVGVTGVYTGRYHNLVLTS
jgi:alpha-tubulin suppressor-like RCC1 family protein